MGNSIDLYVFYGIRLNVDDLPWGEGDHEDWWRDLCEFVPTFFPYTDDGNYKDGISETSPELNKYWEERRAFDKQNPCPFGVEYEVTYDSDYRFIVAVRSIKRICWGPIELSFANKHANLKHDHSRFLDFIRQQFAESGEPSWWVMPFYG